ncbi:MAG: hypothetical protein AAF570_00260, partial [Bacteroidota bacterium]
MKNLRHIFFDLDHTLWDYESNAAETLEALFGRYREHMGGIELETFLPVYHRHNERLWKDYRENKIPSKELRAVRWHDAFNELK